MANSKKKEAPVVETKASEVVEPAAPAVAEAAPSPDPAPQPTITPEQQAAVDKVFNEARKAAEAILGGSPVAQLGTPSGNVDETQERVQRDHLPGRMRRDRTYIPEVIYDENQGVERRVLRKEELRYALVPQEDFLTYTNMGYKFCKFDGGAQSGLRERGFLGTGEAIFTRTIDGNCRRGDCFLMWIPVRGWEDLAAEDQARVDNETNRAVGSFYNTGYREGIRAWVDVNGVRLT